MGRHALLRNPHGWLATQNTLRVPFRCAVASSATAQEEDGPHAACCCSVDMKASLEVYWQTAVANRESMLETEVSPQLSQCCKVSVCTARCGQTAVSCTRVALGCVAYGGFSSTAFGMGCCHCGIWVAGCSGRQRLHQPLLPPGRSSRPLGCYSLQVHCACRWAGSRQPGPTWWYLTQFPWPALPPSWRGCPVCASATSAGVSPHHTLQVCRLGLSQLPAASLYPACAP